MANEAVLIVANSGDWGALCAHSLALRGDHGFLLSPSGTNAATRQLPRGWNHLQGDTFESEVLDSALEGVTTLLCVTVTGSNHTSPPLSSWVASISTALAQNQGGALFVEVEPFSPEPSLNNSEHEAREGMLQQMAWERLQENSLKDKFPVGWLTLPHGFGPGIGVCPVRTAFTEAIAGAISRWAGRPEHEVRVICQEDALRAIECALERLRVGGERYWVPGEPHVTQIAIAEMILELTGNRGKVIWPNNSLMSRLFSRKSATQKQSKFPSGIDLSVELGSRRPLGMSLREMARHLSSSPL